MFVKDEEHCCHKYTPLAAASSRKTPPPKVPRLLSRVVQQRHYYTACVPHAEHISQALHCGPGCLDACCVSINNPQRARATRRRINTTEKPAAPHSPQPHTVILLLRSCDLRIDTIDVNHHRPRAISTTPGKRLCRCIEHHYRWAAISRRR